MAQPDFLSDGTTPRAVDTKLLIWKKILGQIQNTGTSISSNNPRLDDTYRITRQKVSCALDGASYTNLK